MKQASQACLNILDFIKQYMRVHQRPPTQQEIAGAVNRSLSTVRYHLERMNRSGLILITPNTHRGISLPEEPQA